jgi:hypothetical protein
MVPDEVENEVLLLFYLQYFEKTMFYQIYDKETFHEVLILTNDRN